ncbi:MAG: hypothetical protein U0744_21920 [Gemmataceae bacterium]
MRVLWSLLLVCALGADDPTSGPAVGEKLGDFGIQGVLGENAGKERRFEKETKDKPGVLIFVHKLTRPTLRLLRPIDDFAAGEPKLYAEIVFLAENKEKMETYLKTAEKSLNLKSPVGVCLEGKDGPNGYGLNDSAGVTILVAGADRKVHANFSWPDPNETDARKVIAAAKKAMEKK